MLTVYGISSCDTVKKARSWLAAHGVAHEFHDFKKQGVAAADLQEWASAVGWDKLLNRKGTSWRKLDAAAQASAADAAGAQALVLANPSLIRRPVVRWDKPEAGVTVGFDEKAWAARL